MKTGRAPMAEQETPAPKRRLPVLQDEPESREPAEGEERPSWHWVPLGAFATFLLWLPMSALAEHLVKRAVVADDAAGVQAAAGLWIVGGHAIAFCLGAFGAGVLVGRAGATAGRKHAALGGAL